MLEFYQAYATHEDLMNLTEELLGHVAQTVHGSLTVEYQGTKIDFLLRGNVFPCANRCRRWHNSIPSFFRIRIECGNFLRMNPSR